MSEGIAIIIVVALCGPYLLAGICSLLNEAGIGTSGHCNHPIPPRRVLSPATALEGIDPRAKGVGALCKAMQRPCMATGEETKPR
jgi:hypothetical protein